MHFISKQVLPGIYGQKQRRIRDPRMEKPLYRLFRCKIRQSQILWTWKHMCSANDKEVSTLKRGISTWKKFLKIILL